MAAGDACTCTVAVVCQAEVAPPWNSSAPAPPVAAVVGAQLRTPPAPAEVTPEEWGAAAGVTADVC